MTEFTKNRGAVRSALRTLLALASTAASATLLGDIPDIRWARLSTELGDIPPAPGGDQQTASLVGDFDGDGDSDFVITDRSQSPSAFLYLRESDGWSRSILEPERVRIEAGGAVADIDGDGDLDIAFGRDWTGGEVWWWENPLPNASIESTWNRSLIKEGGSGQQHDQAFGDFDGDGKLEFATWANQRQDDGKPARVEIYEIPANPKNLWNLDDSINMAGEGMDVADVDQDGVVDILAGTKWIKWHGAGDYRASAIESSYPSPSTRIAAGQFVPGGRPEVLINSGDSDGPLYFYQHDGSGWNRTELLPLVHHGHTLEVGDIDLDGNLDFFTAEMGDPGAGADCRAWIAWGDGAGGFEFSILSVGVANHESRLVDLDGDGDLDVLSKPYSFGAPRLDAFLNDTLVPGLSLDEWDRHSLDSSMPWQPLDVVAADIDGDGKLDIVSGGWWYRNPGDVGGIWTRRTIGGDLNNMAWVHDFDGDGDMDIFGTDGKHRGGDMGWAENNGSGSFTYHGNIQPGFGGFIQGAVGGVFTEGGPYQILVQWQGGESNGSGVEAFTVPSDPSSGVWQKTVVSPYSAGEQLSPGDLDGDGDLDLFQGTSWLRNDGNDVWKRFVIADFPSWYGIPDRNRLIDIDRDGDLDAVVGLSDFGSDSPPLVWLEHPEDPTDDWPVHVVANGPWGGFSMDAMDIDFDGDEDILLGEHRGATRTLIFENNGNGSTWTQHVVDDGGSGIDHHVGTKLHDMDGDGDLDIISIGWDNDKLWLFENRSAVGPDTEPPSSPEGLAAKAIVGPTISLNWSASTDNQGVTEYRVYRDDALIATVVGTSYMDSDIVEGETYVYHVVAADARSNVSEPSATVSQPSLAQPAAWWNETWPHRVLVTVNTALYSRFDSIVDMEINFSQVLSKQGKASAVDPDTVRVVEIDEVGSVLDTSVPLQFDADPGFNASSAAKGRLIFSLEGETPSETTRYYYIYFAPPSVGATALDFEPDIAVLDDVMDEEQLSVQVTSLTGDLFYHKMGAGFSSWVDIDGNDWIGYAPTGDAEGNFRGIPNMVYPEGHFHPGATTGTSVIESQGPLKVTIRSTAGGGSWECIWEIYGRFARMTVLKAPDDYWFVYEGPPGGTFEGSTDFIVRSDGSSNFASTTWEGDLSGDEWAYVADSGANRALFVALHQSDQAIDSYRPYDGAMTVLGIGRDKRVGSYLEGTPKTFTMGLIEETDYEQAKPYVESAYKPYSVYLRGIGQIQSAEEEELSEPDPEPDPVFNVVSNSSFESGKSEWSFYSNGSDDFSITDTSFEGERAASVSIGSGSNNKQLFQKGIELRPNARYRLSFAAYANTGRDLHVSLSKHGAPYTNYGLSKERVSLGSDWRTYTIDFSTQGFGNPVGDGRLYFWFADLAEPGDNFYIDKVELRRVTGSSIDTIPPVAPSGFAATLDANKHAALSWDASSDNVGVSVYRILREGAILTEVTSTSYTDSSVAPGATYTYQVLALDGAGNVSDPSDQASLEIPGSSGAGPNLLTNGGFESGPFGWTFYSSGDGSAATSSDAFVGSNAILVSIGNGGDNIQLYQEDVQLEPGATYRLSFAAFSSGERDLRVSLAKHESPFTNYGLSRERVDLGSGWQNFVVDFTASGFSSPVSDGRLFFWFADLARPGDFYYLDEIALTKISGGGSSDTESPSIPTSLSASLVSSGVELSWNASVDNVGVSHYRVIRNGATLSDVGTNGYLDASVQPGQTYRYRVVAFDAAGNQSSQSAEALAQIPGDSAPVVSSVENGSFESGMDSWSFYTNGAGDAAPGGPGYAGSNAVVVSINSMGNNIQLYQRKMMLEPNTRYRLSFAAYSSSGRDLEVSLSKHSSPYTNYGLNQDKVDLDTTWRNYSIDFTTTGFGGTVNDGRLYFWFADDAKAGERYYIDQVVLAPADQLSGDSEAPSAPGDLEAALNANTGVQLSWTPSTDNVGVLGYIIYRDGVDIGNTASASFADTGLAMGRTYVYTVTAFDAAGNESGVSVSANVNTPNDGQAPAAPEDLKAVLLEQGVALVSWTAAFDADGVASYRILRDGSTVGESTTTSYLDTTLSSNTNYSFRIVAIDELGNESEASGSVSANTAAVASQSPITNGDYESGLTGWNFFTSGSGSANTSGIGYQGAGSAATMSLFSRASNIQLYQSGIALKANTEYTLVFAAKSNTGNNMEVSISKHVAPYTDYGLNREEIDLSEDWRVFAIEFQTKNFGGMAGDARLYFWLADDAFAGDVYSLDNVYLFER